MFENFREAFALCKRSIITSANWQDLLADPDWQNLLTKVRATEWGDKASDDRFLLYDILEQVGIWGWDDTYC